MLKKAMYIYLKNNVRRVKLDVRTGLKRQEESIKGTRFSIIKDGFNF